MREEVEIRPERFLAKQVLFRKPTLMLCFSERLGDNCVNACDWRTVATRWHCFHAFQPRGAAVECQENRSASLTASHAIMCHYAICR